MKRRYYLDDKAQSALFDAIVFFIIMVMLASIMFFFTTMASQNVEVYTRNHMTAYAEDAFHVLSGDQPSRGRARPPDGRVSQTHRLRRSYQTSNSTGSLKQRKREPLTRAAPSSIIAFERLG